MTAFKSRHRCLGRWWIIGTTLAVASAFMIVFVAASGANLAGSSFEGNDGNLVVNTSGNTDWANVAGLNTGIDKPSGSTDNAFGQGTKEDNANTNVVTGSIPPNKNDLTRFYEASEQVQNGAIFLYLGWERLVNIGNANLDFEINQHATSGFTSSTTGPVTLNRTAGDLLVTYDFGGSGTPTLGLNTWLTAAAGNTVSQCLSANSLPCWGKHVTLTGSNSEGAVNTGTISEPIAGGNLGTGLFGEAAINLTQAGVFPPGVCEAFGSAFAKSRSSSSFTAELKDFIAPIAVNVSNCGSITIHKVTENGDSSFGYTTTGGLSPSTFSLSNGGTQTYDKLGAGSYSVTENLTQAQIDAGWTLKDLSCGTVTGSGTSVNIGGSTVGITLGNGGTVDCTYTNHTKLSPTIATTLSANPVDVGSTVHDSATLSGATADADGTVTYTVYTNSSCTTSFADGGTKTVTNGSVPDSDPVTFNAAGDYYWQAVYSGDANNNQATSDCTSEHLVVNKKQPANSTAQSLIPNDSFTLSGGFNPTGSITFNLYSPSDATCSGAPALTETVTVNGNGTYSTSNSTLVASAEGTWRWMSTYSGDSNNQSTTSACGTERFTIANS
jgi:hypothetical protein